MNFLSTIKQSYFFTLFLCAMGTAVAGSMTMTVTEPGQAVTQPEPVHLIHRINPGDYSSLPLTRTLSKALSAPPDLGTEPAQKPKAAQFSEQDPTPAQETVEVVSAAQEQTVTESSKQSPAKGSAGGATFSGRVQRSVTLAQPSRRRSDSLTAQTGKGRQIILGTVQDDPERLCAAELVVINLDGKQEFRTTIEQMDLTLRYVAKSCHMLNYEQKKINNLLAAHDTTREQTLYGKAEHLFGLITREMFTLDLISRSGFQEEEPLYELERPEELKALHKDYFKQRIEYVESLMDQLKNLAIEYEAAFPGDLVYRKYQEECKDWRLSALCRNLTGERSKRDQQRFESYRQASPEDPFAAEDQIMRSEKEQGVEVTADGIEMLTIKGSGKESDE